MQDQPEKHGAVTYALLEQPRPGNREIRMREAGGLWLQRNEQRNEESKE